MKNSNQLIKQLSNIMEKDKSILNLYRKQAYEYTKINFSDENKKNSINKIINEI